VNFPRIDLAIDDRKPYLNILELIKRTKEGLLSSKMREMDFHDSGELKEEVFAIIEEAYGKLSGSRKGVTMSRKSVKLF